jgi:chromosome segregation and condensation protein ScpB
VQPAHHRSRSIDRAEAQVFDPRCSANDTLGLDTDPSGDHPLAEPAFAPGPFSAEERQCRSSRLSSRVSRIQRQSTIKATPIPLPVASSLPISCINFKAVASTLSSHNGEAEILATLRRLTRRYATRGLRVKEQQGRYHLVIAPTTEKAVIAYHQESGFLSDAAYEVLALVAYLQPITASRLLELQGTDGSHALQTLQDAGFVVGTPGEESPLFFRTTEAFLRAAELVSLDELPPPLIWQESTAGNEHALFR